MSSWLSHVESEVQRREGIWGVWHHDGNTPSAPPSACRFSGCSQVNKGGQVPGPVPAEQVLMNGSFLFRSG